MSKTKYSSACSSLIRICLPAKQTKRDIRFFFKDQAVLRVKSPQGHVSGHSQKLVSQIKKAAFFFVEKEMIVTLSNSAEKGCMSPLALVRRLLKYSYLPTAGFSATAVLCASERVHTQIKPSDIRAHHNKLKHIQTRRHKREEMGTRTPPKKLSGRDL